MDDDDDFNSVAWDTGAAVHHPNPFQDVHSTLAAPQADAGSRRSLDDLARGAGENHGALNREEAESVPPSASPYSAIVASLPLPRKATQEDPKRTSFTTFGAPKDNTMVISVSDPQKHDDKEPYVTYLVTTKTTLETFAHSECQCRRRFQDFVWLKNALKDDFPHCIVPPLPEKHSVVGYIVSDRFSPAFLEKRRCGLDRYLNRIARHPTLRLSPSLRTFLESKDFNAQVAEKQKNSATVFDNLSDTLLNAFAKIKKKDERFIEMKETVEKLDHNLSSIEKLYQRVIKRQGELEQEYIDFSNAIMTLGSMETGMTDALNAFAQTLDKFVLLIKDMSQQEQDEFVTNIREYLVCCQNAKAVLKLRDQKQVDFEDLSDYLQVQVAERERTLNPSRGSGSLLSTIKDKYGEMKGVDQEQARHDKIEKLKFRIAELQEAVESSNEVAVAFSNEVAKEFDRFEVSKSIDMKAALRTYTAGQIEFYKKGMELWESIIPVLERIPTED